MNLLESTIYDENYAQCRPALNRIANMKKDPSSYLIYSEGGDNFLLTSDIEQYMRLNEKMSVEEAVKDICHANNIHESNVLVVYDEACEYTLNVLSESNTIKIERLNNDIAYLENCVVNEADILNEAKFSFLPKFKDQLPKKLVSDLEDAQSLLASNGIENKAGAEKAGRIACRILDIFNSISSVVSLALCITIIGIPIHLMARLVSWALRSGEEEFAKSNVQKVIAKLSKLKNETKDAKLKSKIDKEINKLQKQLNKINGKDDED